MTIYVDADRMNDTSQGWSLRRLRIISKTGDGNFSVYRDPVDAQAMIVDGPSNTTKEQFTIFCDLLAETIAKPDRHCSILPSAIFDIFKTAWAKDLHPNTNIWLTSNGDVTVM
jgi:hypothetical protein